MRILYLVLVLLSACTSAPVGWGGTYEVVFSDKDTIKLQWDRMAINDEAVTQKAVEYCQKSGRSIQVVDASSDPTYFGLIRSRTWRCV